MKVESTACCFGSKKDKLLFLTMGSFGPEGGPPCERCRELPSVFHCDSQGLLCNRCAEWWSMGFRSGAAAKALAEQKEKLEHSKAALREILYWQLTSKAQGWHFRNTVREIVGWERCTECLRRLKMVEAQRRAGGG